MPTARPTEVTVAWHVATAGAATTEALAGLLDADERARLARFRQAEDRWSYAAAHALLRRLLSDRHGGDPTHWRFASGSHGKPRLDPAAHPGLAAAFSLSHTRGLALCALASTDDLSLGIDGEDAARGVEELELADRFFAPLEAEALRHLEPAARRQAFYATWTLKEAVVKALGLGLHQPLDSFACRLDPPRLDSDDPALLPLDGWTLSRLDLDPPFVGALALRHPPGQEARLMLRRLGAAALLGR